MPKANRNRTKATLLAGAAMVPVELNAGTGNQSSPPHGSANGRSQADTVPAERHLLTEKETAEYLRLSPRTLQRYRDTGGGPPFVRLSERRLAYPLAEAVQWEAKRTYTSRASELAGPATNRS